MPDEQVDIKRMVERRVRRERWLDERAGDLPHAYRNLVADTDDDSILTREVEAQRAQFRSDVNAYNEAQQKSAPAPQQKSAPAQPAQSGAFLRMPGA